MNRKELNEMCTIALSNLDAYRRGEITWDQMMWRFPEDEEYEDEDLSELIDLVGHEQSPGLLPSSKKIYRDWKAAVDRVVKRLRSRANIDPE